MAPLRWDGTRRELLFARRLLVRVAFRGEDETTRKIPTARRGPFARLVTRGAGLHAVSYEDLFGRKRRPIAARDMRLSRLGESVAFHVQPTPSIFRPGSTLYFVSHDPAANPYDHENVYELELGVRG